QTLGQLWQAGVVVDWAAFTQQEERRRVPLPTYPFERQRYWIDPPHKTAMVTAATAASEKKRAIGDWFYAPSWERAPLAPHQPSSTLEPCLFFLDESRITEQLAQRIEQLRPVIRVHVARTYQKYDEKHYALPIADDEGYRRLFENLKHDRLLPTQIIHAWSMTSTTSSAQDRLGFEQQQRSGLYSLLALTRALMAVESIDTVTLTVLTNHLYAVTGQEELYPEQATLIGACKVIAQEYPGLQTCCLDLDDNAMGLLDPLIVELTRGFQDREVAYRGNQRWVPRFTLRHLDPPTQPCFREHGVYLLTGGLGGVGLKLAEAIARQVHATIVLLGRHGLPERAHWEQWITEHGSADATSTRIRAVQDLERLGAEVNVVACDVADLEQLRHVVTSLDTQYGRLDGVIHCAGYTTREAFQYIQHVQVEDCQRHFQSKVYGLYALEQVLQGRDLDFCMVFSSLSAVLGGLGFFAYASANAFVDAFVTRHNQHASQHWVCVDWDTWQVSSIETSGMSMSGTVAGYSMTPQEGVEAFQRILASQAEHLIQSTGDLQTRIRQWVYLEEATPTTTDSASSNTSPSPVLRQTALATPADNLEQRLADIWGRVLGLAQVSLTDNFFDMGGNSLIGLQVISKIRKELHVQISNVALFEAPTIQAMARYLRPKPEIEPSSELNVLQQRRRRAQQKTGVSEIAIVGMSGRFPGANTIEQFWENLCAGKESISFFSDEELLAAGLDPELIAQPHYVKARPILDDVAGFDAAFFGYSPREAELMDPQHRLFLEGCWEALEHAGYDPHAYAGLIGVFGGSNISTYLLQILQRPDVAQDMNIYQMVISNDKDSLTTTVSYKLNLKGPSYGVQTFCSTSLVAIHLAGQSLLNGECDMALAGGVSVRVPPVAGHLYEEGGMESPDGHCRTFDADARGGMFGDGVGLVVLKRLEDALQDGDTVYAVIKGSAINNDGSLKVSYTAPSVVGQTEVVSMALETAAVHPESIQYLEAHGTATELGDPIEVTSLTKAFRLQTQKKQYCAIGSVKTNVGHLDRAAGVSGLIKIVMGLRHQQIPASLHYHTPNPAIDFENSPFYVNTALAPWEPNLNGLPRRAGLNSLGMGGTNAHVVLEEA
ncbi:MAG TPA: SDR family oxidoreductase, partial [Ktedonobacteraceae bacterium]|nr:SDR family oxidoreductase [Ktedonobacteraceae bacterium]